MRCHEAGLIAALVAIATAPLAGQRPTTLPGTEQRNLTSERTGFTYRIDVSLPPSYSTASTRRYPVIYLLDGNLEFALAVQAQRMVSIDGHVPELIIVGVGYQEDDPAVYTPTYATNRTRDYTPTAPADHPEGGKAAEFLAFLREQLIPLIDGAYRTDPADRGLGGHSLGGLFTTYALLHEPTLFKRYWIGSPSLWYDRGVAFSWLGSAPTPAAGTRTFLTVGALESDVMVPPMRRMAAALKARFPGLEVKSTIYPEEYHGSVVAGSIGAAFRVLYRRPTVAIAPGDARALVGRWVAPGGAVLTIVSKAGGLMIRDSVPGIAIALPLKAYGRDELYAESLGVPYWLERDASGRIVTIKRAGLGPDSLFQRVR